MQDLHEACLDLRRAMTRWLQHSSRVDAPGPNYGGEDEANYALAWFQHYLVTGEEGAAERFRALLGDLETWVDMDCHHGYEPEAEAHHGTEPFLLFLPRYLGLFPRDEVARVILEDAAHHIGNWVDGIPDWYDYSRDVFRSYRIGTRVVDTDTRYRYELAEHFRFIHIALAAYRVTGEERYVAWALRYGRRRAERITAVGNGPMPVLWDLEGHGLLMEDLKTREQHVMAASNHHVQGDPLAGVENLLASGAIYALGDLYRLSGEEIFRDAAMRIVRPLVPELLDPFADPGAAAVSYYRWAFDDTSLDQQIMEVLAAAPPASAEPRAMVFPQDRVRREPGVGKRNDMIYWGRWREDGGVEPSVEPSTAALVLAYQLSGDAVHAERALRTAGTKLLMAQRVLRGGREHADMGGAVCSVAAGHGRNWGQGAVTGCYGPLLLGSFEVQGAVQPLLELDAGRLPEQVVSLVVPPVGDRGKVAFRNFGDKGVDLQWRAAGETAWRTLALAAKQSVEFSIRRLK